MNQDELIVLLQDKSEKAFGILYQQYSRSLLGVIQQMIPNTDDAEDTLQEVFVKIWNGIDSYHPSKGRLYTWMVNIARNAAIDKLRSKGYNNSQKNQTADKYVNKLEDENDWVSKIDVIGIQSFVEKLPEKCFKIIELLFFQGYTQQEASEELDIPLGTIKTRNRNCINDLRKLLKLS